MWYRDKMQSEDRMQYAVGNHLNVIKSLESSKSLESNRNSSLNIPRRDKERPLGIP